MESPAPRFKEPPPRLVMIDLGAGAEDRFSPPQASIVFSTDGKRLYGVQSRPACRVLRYASEAATAAANAAADERQAVRPAGRRHDAYLTYLASLRRNEQDWGLKILTQQSSPARGLYKTKLGGSEGVASCLVWRQGSEDEEALGEWDPAGSSPSRRRCCLSPGATSARPCTAPPASSLSPMSLDVWHPVTCAVLSPRFRSRAAFEQRRAATPDTEAIKKTGYLVRHQKLKTAHAAKEAKEAELLRAWPHGLPQSELRKARAGGLRVVGLGIGGNPLSLPRRQFEALYSPFTSRWY